MLFQEVKKRLYDKLEEEKKATTDTFHEFLERLVTQHYDCNPSLSSERDEKLSELYSLFEMTKEEYKPHGWFSLSILFREVPVDSAKQMFGRDI